MTAYSNRSRFVRRSAARNIDLTERDIEGLKYLYRYRFLRSDHLVALLCPPDGYGSKRLIDRLRELFHTGFIDRPKVQLDYQRFGGKKTMVYGLSDLGADVLQQRAGIERGAVNWQWKNRSAKRLFLDHTLAVADFLVGIETAARRRDDLSFIPDQEIGGGTSHSWRVDVSGYDFGSGSVGLVPDAFFGLQQHGRPKRLSTSYFFVEVDRATMPVFTSNPERSSIYKKLLGYHESWKQKLHTEHFGIAGVRTLFLTTSPERRDHFRQAASVVADEQPYPRRKGKHLLFSTQEDAVRETLDHRWHNARDDDLVQLI